MKQVFNRPMWYYIPIEGVDISKLATLPDAELQSVLQRAKRQEDQKLYQINPNFILKQVADEWLVVSTGEMAQQFNGMMSLNASSHYMWELFLQPNSIAGVLQALKEHYEGDAENMEGELRQFVARCRAFKILQEVSV